MTQLNKPAMLVVKARYSDNPDVLFQRAGCFADMIDATLPISTYTGLPPVRMEAGVTYTSDIKVFGLVKTPNYEIRVDSICDQTRRIETSEGGGAVRAWNHTLEVVPDGDGAMWIDRVALDAGMMTPIVARFARYMYLHRHGKRQAISVSASLTRSCRPANRDLPLYHPLDRSA